MRLCRFGAGCAALLVSALATAARAQSSPPLTPNHPGVASPGATPDNPEDEELPPGHPAPPSPHGQGQGQGRGAGDGAPNRFKAPADSSQEDPSLPPGTILVELRDPEDHPLPNEEVGLGIVVQSIAKGESRRHLSSRTDDAGRTSFAQLENGSGFAYRVTCAKDGGTFAAMPFQIQQGKSMRVVLHVYPVTHDIRQASIGIKTIFYLELKDDRVQFEQVFGIFNVGKTAWVPDDALMALPDGFTALTSQQGMSDQGVDAVDKHGARLHGTFPPGQHIVDYRWQLPYDGEDSVDVDVEILPHVFGAVVRTPAADPSKLSVDGFPVATRALDEQGQSVLATEKELREGDPLLTHLHVKLSDLPTPGPGRKIATVLAAGGVLFGLGLAVTGSRDGSRKARQSGAGKTARQQMLAELEDLELARLSGDVGPKTYERARRDIIDAIARTLEK